jgi:Peroxisomal biogenesis factor 11 (PEX11)
LVFLRLSYSKELELRSSKMLKMLTPQSALKITSELSQERHYIILNIFRNIADIAIIINKLKFPEIFLRTSFNEGVIGVCGISSSALSLYHFYFKSIYGKTKKKKSGNFGGKLKWEEKFEISLLMDHVFE